MNDDQNGQAKFNSDTASSEIDRFDHGRAAIPGAGGAEPRPNIRKGHRAQLMTSAAEVPPPPVGKADKDAEARRRAFMGAMKRAPTSDCDDAASIAQAGTDEGSEDWASTALRPAWLPDAGESRFVCGTRIEAMPVEGGEPFYMMSRDASGYARSKSPVAKAQCERLLMSLRETMEDWHSTSLCGPTKLAIGDRVEVDGHVHVFLGATLGGRLAFADDLSASGQRRKVNISVKASRIHDSPSRRVH